MTNAVLIGNEGEVPCHVFGETVINNKKFLIVDLGSTHYVKGILSRFHVVSIAALKKEINGECRSSEAL